MASDATIMALAGHLSVKMKERYSRVRVQAKRQAIATLDQPLATVQRAGFCPWVDTDYRENAVWI